MSATYGNLFNYGSGYYKGEPEADFSASPLSGDVPILVNFLDLSIGADSWDWDFGDGSSHSTVQNPTHTYTVAGAYTVTLSIDGGLSTKIRTNYITGNIHADFSGTPTTGNIPVITQFTDLSTGSPDSWEWDFGDGISSISRLQNPRHFYTIPGIYAVSLTVRRNGVEDTIIKTSYITVPSYSIDFIGVPLTGRVPLSVKFTEILNNIVPSEIAWDFGDGEISSISNPSHTYKYSGKFSVSMSARINL